MLKTASNLNTINFEITSNLITKNFENTLKSFWISKSNWLTLKLRLRFSKSRNQTLELRLRITSTPAMQKLNCHPYPSLQEFQVLFEWPLIKITFKCCVNECLMHIFTFLCEIVVLLAASPLKNTSMDFNNNNKHILNQMLYV